MAIDLQHVLARLRDAGPLQFDPAIEHVRAIAAEHRILDDVLNTVERTERQILTALGCPVNPAAIHAILAGEMRPPWPKKTARRDRQRARHAMVALTCLSQTRHHLAAGDSRWAAYHALFVGVFAGNAAIEAAFGARKREGLRQGGRTRGDQQTDEAQARGRRDAELRKRWHRSDSLQEQYSSPDLYIQADRQEHLESIKRRRRRLGRSKNNSS